MTRLPNALTFGGPLDVIANSSFADFAAHHFPQASIQTYPDWREAVRAVRTGEVVRVYRPLQDLQSHSKWGDTDSRKSSKPGWLKKPTSTGEASMEDRATRRRRQR